MFEPFFAGVAAGQLRFPRCDACGQFHWYPKAWCPFCAGTEMTWTSVSGEATLFSWTTVHRAFSEEFRERVPYTLGLVEFADAPNVRLLAELILPPGRPPSCGMAIRCQLPAAGEGPLVRLTSA